jgi:hypothetical protein
MIAMLQAFVGGCIGAGVVSLVVRQLITRSIEHAFETHRMHVQSEIQRAANIHQAQLSLWSSQQLELLKRLVGSQAAVIGDLVRRASMLRCAALPIGGPRHQATVEELYGQYFDLYYKNPVLPKPLFEAAHGFRRVSEKMVGACSVAGATNTVERRLVGEFEQAYALLVEEARKLLIPGVAEGEAIGQG